MGMSIIFVSKPIVMLVKEGESIILLIASLESENWLLLLLDLLFMLLLFDLRLWMIIKIGVFIRVVLLFMIIC